MSPLASFRAMTSQSPTRRARPSVAAGATPADADRFERLALLGLGIVELTPEIDGERNLSLIPPGEREDRPQRAIQIERRVGLPDNLAPLFHGDLDPPALDLHLHVLCGGSGCARGSRLAFFRNRAGARLERRLRCTERLFNQRRECRSLRRDL